MSKRGLYPTISKKKSTSGQIRLMMNLISLCDGKSSLLEIAEILNVPIWDLYEIIKKLESQKLINVSNL